MSPLLWAKRWICIGVSIVYLRDPWINCKCLIELTITLKVFADWAHTVGIGQSPNCTTCHRPKSGEHYVMNCVSQELRRMFLRPHKFHNKFQNYNWFATGLFVCHFLFTTSKYSHDPYKSLLKKFHAIWLGLLMEPIRYGTVDIASALGSHIAYYH